MVLYGKHMYFIVEGQEGRTGGRTGGWGNDRGEDKVQEKK